MILLVRHGQTDWNVEPARCQGWADVPLNEVGRAQARDLGRALRGRGLELVVTSHLRRARETAELLCEALQGGGTPASAGDGAAPPGSAVRDLPLILDPRLAETHRGAWEGRAFAEIVASEPGVWRHYREHPEDFRFPDGESLVEQQRRVLACLRDVALDGRRTVLVTHGGSMRLARCFLEGRGIAIFHRETMRNGAVAEIDDSDLASRIGSFLLGNS